jgi:DNA mismatch repair protein MutS2
VNAKPSSSVFSRATAQALEFPSFLAVLGQLAASDLGMDLIAGLAPRPREELAAQRLRFEEAARLLAGGGLVPDFDMPVGGILDRLSTGTPAIEGIDLVRLADLARASRKAAERTAAADPPCPRLQEWAASLPDLEPLLRRIERTLDRRGEVREDASPKLTALRRQIRQTRDVIYRDLGDYVTSHRDELSEETIPMRNGRLVVVLQSGSRGRSAGLLHGRSTSGKSFYFEPLSIVESNNTLQQSAEDAEAERKRILAELLAAARAALPDLRDHAAWLAELDLLQAVFRFAERAEAHLPEIASHGELRLVAARHPLLDPALADLREEALGRTGSSGAIVPLDLELTEESRTLVVTGPNAGGKTVALKTAGLLSLIAQCGLPIPAARGSRVPVLERIVAIVGDEQDLLADRSTFSGRLLRLREAWEEAGPDSLVLLDELGSGTDPEEGAALSISLLEGLLAKRSLAIITTHLTPLAAAALEMDGASCAAMEFDPDTGRPTFHLMPGPPGGSEALALARRLGLPAAWLDRAEARLGSAHRDLRKLISEVERLRHELGTTRDELRIELEDAEKLRRRLASQEAALEEERRTLAHRMKGELDLFRRETLGKLRREVERIEESFEEGRRKGLAAEAVERLFEEAPRFAEPSGEPGGPLVVGGTVRHRGLGWEGVLEKLEDDRAQVLVRGMRVRCRADELALPGHSGKPAPAKARSQRPVLVERLPAGDAKPTPPGRDLDERIALPTELNLIGLRVEPALEQLDDYLDRALLASKRAVRVIHGHGTGRLRKAVRDHLRGHPGVDELRAGAENEGGDGATVVTLRSA